MLQSFITAFIVLGAALYTAWIVMPATWRRAASARLARQARRSGLDQTTARKLQLRLESTAACGDCASCKGCAAGAAKPSSNR